MAKLPKAKRDKLILVIVGTIAIVLCLWYLVIKEIAQSKSQQQTKLDAVIDKLEKARERIKKSDLIETEMEAATKKLKTIEDTMASGTDLYSWSYLLLEKARAGHDVNIVDVTRPSKGDIGVLAQFPYDAAIFNVRGSAYYHDFGKFLADFENKFPYFRIQGISLGTVSDNAAGPEVATARTGDEKLLFKLDVVALIKPTP